METFMIALGDELRAARKRKGWTRRDLVRHLQVDLSLQTIATWELGTRHITAERLYYVCTALGELVEDLLARVRMRIEEPDNLELGLDLAAAALTTRARLGPVRAWAQCRLREHLVGEPVVRLDVPALDRLAEVCELSTLDLTDRLTRAGLVRPLAPIPLSCEDAV